MKHKAGNYRLVRSQELFWMLDGVPETEELNVYLTDKEVKALFKDGLHEKLGLHQWTYLGEVKTEIE